jgi:multisubunit Na+/H+ antiporter MnhF subunit
MTESLNPAAPHHLPSFTTAPGETDVLMVITAIILVLSILAFGILFLRLHTLPERLAHKSQKIQFEIVAVLGLLALFTHKHIFWVLGLLLALIDIPDLGSFLGRIAGSVEKIAGVRPPPEEASEAQSAEIVAGDKRVGQPAGLASETHDRSSKAEGPSTSAMTLERKKEASHA